MADAKELLARRLEALKADYERQLPDRIVELRVAWQAAGTAVDDAARQVALTEVRRIAHRLVGSGKTFGQPRISEAAAPIERTVDALLEGALPLAKAGMDAMIARLEHRDEDPAPAHIHPPAHSIRPAPRSARPEPPIQAGLIWLVGLDVPAGNGLSAELARFGFRAEQMPAGCLHDAIATHRPAVVLAELSALREAGCPPWSDPHTPLVGTAGDGSIETRLAAVRLGVSGFVPQPVDPDRLVDLLDRLLERADPEPFRVILVEDDDILADSFAASLEAEGMQVRRLADPMQILRACRAVLPDIIVTDLYLPQADGIEMAQVVRQHGGFDDVPILFVSSETNLNRQLAARRLGADDFLTKPLTSDQLVTAVLSRALRYRDLRRVMDRDSMTGLLNHARTSARLEREIERCREAGETLSAAVIDLDHFKRVNDTYGHATGDKVLRTMSRLLQQRLRGSDTAGRFGGEEFVVVLPGADAEAAFNVLDGLRRMFSEIEHVSGDRRFTVTFSAGLATLHGDDDSAAILARADAALYRAKRDGRNRIGLE